MKRDTATMLVAERLDVLDVIGRATGITTESLISTHRIYIFALIKSLDNDLWSAYRAQHGGHNNRPVTRSVEDDTIGHGTSRGTSRSRSACQGGERCLKC